MKPLIGISCRVTEPANYSELRNSISFDFISFISKLNAIPIILPNTANLIEDYLTLNLNGIILSGGNNPTAKTAGTNEMLDDSYQQRDDVEYLLIKNCIEKNIPLIGVCRGAQIINCYFGGTIEKSVTNHVAVSHMLDSTDPLYDKKIVNSYHNYTIYNESLGSELETIGLTSDGSIEYFKHINHNITGIVWHPERQNFSSDVTLFKNSFKL